MSKKPKYTIAEGKAGTELTLNVQGLPHFVTLTNDLPDKVLGWLSRNTDLVEETEPQIEPTKKAKNDCCE